MRLDALGERLFDPCRLKPGEFRFNEAPAAVARCRASQRKISRWQNSTAARPAFQTDGKPERLPRDPRVAAVRRQGEEEAHADDSSSGRGLQRIQLRLAHRSVQTACSPCTREWISPWISGPPFRGAGGVVIYSGPHPQYGFLVEIDHGNDFTTATLIAREFWSGEGEVVQRRKQDRRIRIHRSRHRPAPCTSKSLPHRGAEPDPIPSGHGALAGISGAPKHQKSPSRGFLALPFRPNRGEQPLRRDKLRTFALHGSHFSMISRVLKAGVRQSQ